jgi:hypothetical protein
VFWGSYGFGADQQLPVINGKKTVATVNDEPITLEEMNQAVASSHATRSKGKTAGHIDYSNILNRLINLRLIVLEAKNMGLDELPDLKRQVAGKNREFLIEILLERHVSNIRPDEDEIERIYQNTVREWKIKSVLFKKEEDAKKIAAELKAGKDFDEIVKKAVEWGIAEADAEGKYVKDKNLTPQAAQFASKMEIGATSPILSAESQKFIIFKLEGMRLPEVEEPEARVMAERQALNDAKRQAVKNYYDDLKAKYVKLDQKIFEELDFETPEPGIEKLLKDDRLIAEIMGEKPITVSEFTKTVKGKFHHGIELAIESKRVNKKKSEILGQMLERRVLSKEALKQGIDKTNEYRYRAKEYEDSIIFGTFVNKVIRPEIKLDLKELESHYKENQEQYTSPQMMRIKNIVFLKRQDAVEAIDRLQRGSDFNWLSSHAEGQIDPNKAGIPAFEGQLITLNSLPDALQTTLAGAKKGDFRLYPRREEYFYVLYISQIIDPQTQPFKEVREDIAKLVYNDKIKKAIEFWADQLRAYYPVNIYFKDNTK